jgi:hypothetical protein
MASLYSAGNTVKIYGSRASPPTSLKDLKEANFTFHHIMPYCYAAMIGHIVDTIIREVLNVDESSNARKLGDNLDIICSQLLAEEFSFTDLREVDLSNNKPFFVHKFAWMGANLFMGPEGNWRLDDPGHAPEQNKPVSFERNQWDRLTNIYAELNRNFSFAKVTGTPGQDDGGYAATPLRDLDWKGNGNFLTSGSGLIPTLKSLCHGESRKPHAFQMDDWVIVDSDEREWKKLLFSLSEDEPGAVKKAKQKLAALELQDKVILCRPVAIKGVDKEYPTMAMQSRKLQDAARDQKALNKNPGADLGLENVKNLFADYEKRPSSVVDDWKAFWRLRTNEPLGELVKIKANFRIGGTKTPEKYL